MVKQVIIDAPETALTHMVTTCDNMNVPMRCLYLPKLAPNPHQVDLWSSLAVRALADYLKADQIESVLYVCADGDTFVLTRQSAVNTFKSICAHIAPEHWAATPRALAQYFELPAQSSIVLKVCADKIEAYQKETAEKKAHQDKAVRAERQAIEQSIDMDISFNSTLIDTLSARRMDRTAPGILVVEDDAFSLRLVTNALRNVGEVYSAGTGREAIQSLIKHAPDIIFLDIGLPDIMGIQVLDEILTVDPAAHVVMLSGNGSKDNVIGATRKGAKGFIGKPFTIEKLTDALGKCPHMVAKRTKRASNHG